MEHEGDGDTDCNRRNWNNFQIFGKEPGRLWEKMTSGDHPDNCIIKVGQNTG